MPSKVKAKSFLEELRRTAGTEAVAALTAACGGVRIYIPHRYVRDQHGFLARAFGGIDAANAIVAKLNAAGFAGIAVDVPVGRGDRNCALRSKVREALLSGCSVAEAARLSGVTERTVRRRRRELVSEHQLLKGGG